MKIQAIFFNGLSTKGSILRITAFILFFSAVWSSTFAQFVPQRQLLAEPEKNPLSIDVNKSLNSDMIGIDEFVLKTNSEQFSSYQNLAAYLSSQFSDDQHISRSIYTWIAYNISYDASLVSGIEQNNQSAEAVWKNRSGVCEGYANLFHEMCTAAGIESRIINGYVKEFAGNDLSYPNHSWNSVKIDGKWKLLDVTWASVNNEGILRASHNLDMKYVYRKLDHFFMVNPNRMILTHLPEDPLWQLRSKGVDFEIFVKGENSIKSKLRNSNGTPADFEELIAEYESLDSLDRSISFLERMERSHSSRSREYGLGIAYYYKAQKILKEANVENRNAALQKAKKFYEKSLHQLSSLKEEDYGYEFSRDLVANVVFRIETLD